MATQFSYPSRDIDSAETLLSLLGSFWSRVYTANGQMLSYAGARGQVELQKTIDLQEAVDAIGRDTVPVYHTDRWYLLSVRESQRNATEPSLLAYGDNHVDVPAVYGRQSDGFEYQYGVDVSKITSSFPIPTDLRDVAWIFDKIGSPEITWSNGTDFYLDLTRQLLVCRNNPFDDNTFEIREIYENGEQVDREARLWLFQARFDREHIWNHFGYILKAHLPSSDAYRKLVNSVFNGVVEGTATQHLSQAFAAIADTEIVQEETETVEAIQRDSRHLLVITDRHVYRYKKTAREIVAVGQVVHRYDQLVDTVAFYEFNRGQLADELVVLEIPREMLDSDYLGGIVFYNKSVPLEVGSDGVFTTVQFEVGGFPGDVTRFWQQFHARGIASPPTLAQLLDNRTNQVGEPTAAALPPTINPLQFLVENVLRYNAYVVRVKLNQFGDNAAGIEQIRLLQMLIPPHTTMLLLVELAADNDIVTMEGSGSDTLPGYVESLTAGIGNEAPAEEIDPSLYVVEQPRLTQTAGRCL